MTAARNDFSVLRLFRLSWRLAFPVLLLAFRFVWSVSYASAQCAAMPSAAAKPQAWSGILVSSACNADEAFNESPECTKSVPGAKFALYDDTNRVIYALAPQERVTAHLGEAVTVHGAIDSDTIQFASMEPMALGLAVGEKAPAFSVRDQFGQVQTLDSLKGTNGTVLLFFRSADW
jgi:hypothetical protein